MGEVEAIEPCEICYPAIDAFGEAVPGYLLVRFLDERSSHHGFHAGDYALFVDHHHAVYRWSGEPVADPFAGYTDERWAALPPCNHPLFDESARHEDYVERIEPMFLSCPERGYYLTKSCFEAGWDGKGELLSFLMDRIARRIAAGKGG